MIVVRAEGAVICRCCPAIANGLFVVAPPHHRSD
jgi:hypothetical protein